MAFVDLPPAAAWEAEVKQPELKRIFERAQSLTAYCEGEARQVGAGTPSFDAVIAAARKMARGAREMPALSVTLDKEVQAYKERGHLSVEFAFPEALTVNGLPFDRLFIRLERNFYGLNLERHYEGAYGGRCLYLNLEKSASVLYDALNALFE